MNTRTTIRGLAAIGVLAILVQAIPVDRSNPPVESDIAAPPKVEAVLRRACYDCHSNETVWAWYSRVAPAAWLDAWNVREGRRSLNFSRWGRYDADARRRSLEALRVDIDGGSMPPFYYLWMHPGARLSGEEKVLLRSWSTGADSPAAPIGRPSPSTPSTPRNRYQAPGP